MVNYEAAIKRPFSDFGKLAIGTLIGLVPIVNLLLSGYLLECARSSAKKDLKLPQWTNWGELFVHGLVVAAISLIYMIPVIVLLLIFGVRALMTLVSFARGGNFLSNLGGLGGTLILMTVLAIVIGYVLMSAILSYSENFVFSDAFDFSKVLSKAFKGDYALIWLITVVGGGILASILSFIPALGAAFAGFVTGVFSYTAFGEIYSKL
ncbi:DUF4013 domain-containing protein [Candidatus Woesearchaeota archaeon]|nr:DUF4013 domain-containing protein [Candidatus Woesearchaeota archaeon]